jgi:ribosomal 50S subunit-associated protein YjgA (DUF615 family)
MTPELPVNRSKPPRLVPAVVRKDRHRRTKLARRRRLNWLIRELGHDLGFDIAAMTLAERGAVHQCATLLLQLEIAQDQLVRGDAVIDHDVCIRLTSEARRLLAGLRKRAKAQEVTAPPPRGPLRTRYGIHPAAESKP